MASKRLTEGQRQTLRIWSEQTSYAPEQFYYVHHIFGARNNQDNARRRTMHNLIEQGAVFVGQPENAGCIPPVKGGNPLKEEVW